MQKSSTQGPLAGIPGLIKDNICQEDRLLPVLKNFRKLSMRPYDATAIARLKKAGAPLLGRANMDEFAMGSSTETSAYKKQQIRGILSGSWWIKWWFSAAVAAGLVPWALGSETVVLSVSRLRFVVLLV